MRNCQRSRICENSGASAPSSGIFTNSATTLAARSPFTKVVVALGCISFLSAPLTARADNAIHVDSVVVTLIEQAEVSAREAGAIANIEVHEGQLVEEGAPLARLEDSEAILARNKAVLDLDIAKKQAASDVKIRYAKKALEVAAAEERRAQESIEKFSRSVSQSELDQLRLAKEKAALEVEQADEDKDINQLTTKLKENAVETANNDIERRHVAAPMTGVIVQIKHHRGEWVQAGDPIVRILRTDHLRAEAFLNSHDVTGDLVGRPVTLLVDLPGAPKSQFPGKVTFVSPEVNPVNGQFRVWAEIENPQQKLRAGVQGSMVIAMPGQ
jgi:multidrug efflux pump subunit AcrA (membrane-fusion protein)